MFKSLPILTELPIIQACLKTFLVLVIFVNPSFELLTTNGSYGKKSGGMRTTINRNKNETNIIFSKISY